MKTRLYFIALIPEEDICEEVTEFKEYAARHFDSAHALSSPPHITLISPFRWNAEEEQKLKTVLQIFAADQPSVLINLNGFDHFGERVIFVDVEESEKLQQLQQDLSIQLKQTLGLPTDDERPFRPHMTVAFKDLSRNKFPKAWEHYQRLDYERTFLADQLFLLRHEEKRWRIEAGFRMAPGSTFNNNL